MVKCKCGCDEEVTIKHPWRPGHWIRLNNPREGQYFVDYHPTIFYTIPTLCACGCGQTVWARGKTFVHGHHARIFDGFKGKQHKKEQKQKWHVARAGKQLGANGPNWKGGLSFLPYCYKFNEKFKKKIRERDNCVCQLCGLKQNDLHGYHKKLAVHHVHYDKENCYPDVITLCLRCNCNVNTNRKHYEQLFMNKLNDRGLLFWARLNQII